MFKVTGVFDDGNDLLRVTGIDPDETAPLIANEEGALVADPEWAPMVYTVFGWVSATTNHYDAGSYDQAGHLRPDARPRTMTAAEVGDYARGLLEDAHPAVAAPPEPRELAFQ